MRKSNRRFNWFMLECYCENEWIYVIEDLLKNFDKLDLSYCMIYHNKDKYYNGMFLNPNGYLVGSNYILTKDDIVDFKKGLKKPHFHIIVHSYTQFTPSAFAKYIGLNVRWVQGCNDYVLSLRYLIHLDNKDKYQYDKSCVDHGDNLYAYNKFLDYIERDCNASIDQADVSMEIFEYIDERAEVVTMTEIFRYCCGKGKKYDAWLVRHSGIIRQVLFEHNALYMKEEKEK